MIDWMVFYAPFNSISVISLRQLTFFMSFLGFTSTRLGYEVSCPRTLPRKNPEDSVRLEPRTPGLWIKHFTTEPRVTRIMTDQEKHQYAVAALMHHNNLLVMATGIWKGWSLPFCSSSASAAGWLSASLSTGGGWTSAVMVTTSWLGEDASRWLLLLPRPLLLTLLLLGGILLQCWLRGVWNRSNNALWPTGPLLYCTQVGKT